jgi:hypothetical protein
VLNADEYVEEMKIPSLEPLPESRTEHRRPQQFPRKIEAAEVEDEEKKIAAPFGDLEQR